MYLRETTLISPFPVLLFGGDIEVQHRERLLSVDGWIHFQVRPAALVTRSCFWAVEVDFFLRLAFASFPYDLLSLFYPVCTALNL